MVELVGNAVMYKKQTSLAFRRTPSAKSFNVLYAFCPCGGVIQYRGLGWSLFLRFPLSFTWNKKSLQFRFNVCISSVAPVLAAEYKKCMILASTEGVYGTL